MLTSDILEAFNAKVLAALPTTPTAFGGINFDPPSDKPWLEVLPFWNGSADYGVENLAVERGFFRIVVSSKKGGIMPIQRLAEQVVAAFPKGSVFGGAVTDDLPKISGPITETDRILIPVTIRWRATRN